MDSLTAGQPSKKKKSPLSTPLKPMAPAAARPSPWPSSSDEIATPEKPIELPRRTRNRSVAFSLKEVKRVASGLLRSDRVSTDRSEVCGQSRRSVPSAESIALGSDKDGVQSHLVAKSRVKLPEKYEMLLEFFNCMVSSIRLLHLKGRMSSFSKICPQVESLTNRRFSYGHLAQLKYILPEAICVKKILLRDDTTCCMKPDLQVTLQTDPFGPKDHKMGSGHSRLNKVFRDRLLEFFKEHPEGDDVPEMDLPEPFNQTKTVMLSRMTIGLISNSASLDTGLSSVDPSQQESAAPSHMPRSFQRRFSQRVHISGADKLPAGHFVKESSDEMPTSSTISPPFTSASRPPVSKKVLLSSSHIHLSTKEETIEKAMSANGSLEEDVSVGTPAKNVSTPARLMSMTPQLQTPKRCRPDANEDCTPVKAMRRPTRTKLFTTPVKNAKAENEDTDIAVDDALQFLPKALLQSVREKERKVLEDQEAGVADAEKRQRMLACLPKLFDMILLIFQSLGRSVITKQELIYKIIANHCDIVDRSEVEEQLILLQELVPDWISGKMASSGDVLFCVNNASSPKDVRQRLSEAK